MVFGQTKVSVKCGLSGQSRVFRHTRMSKNEWHIRVTWHILVSWQIRVSWLEIWCFYLVSNWVLIWGIHWVLIFNTQLKGKAVVWKLEVGTGCENLIGYLLIINRHNRYCCKNFQNMSQKCLESDIIRSVLHFKTEDYWCTIKCKRIRAPLYVEHHWQLFFSSQRMVEMSSLVSCQIEWCSNWYLSLLLRCLTNQSARPGTRAWQKYLCFPDKVLKLHVSKVQWNWIALTSGIGILNIYLLGAPWVFPITFSLSFNNSADSWSNLAIKDSFGISPEIF